jgi:ElaB/YqjD/DUF883 family membrane-anchored ribosome-binding protein
MNASSEQMNEGARHGSSTSHANSTGSGEMGRFFSDVEDLLKRMTHMKEEDVARLRERVETSLGSARESVSRNASRFRETAGEVADSTDEYVRRSPWTVAGLAMVAGLIVGAALLSSRR